jgi:hypothetical protein
VDPLLKKFIAIDAVDSIDDLVSLAHEVDLTSTIEFVRKHFGGAVTGSEAEGETIDMEDGGTYTNAWLKHTLRW